MDDEQLIIDEFDKIIDELYKLKFLIEKENLLLTKTNIIAQSPSQQGPPKTCSDLFELHFKNIKSSQNVGENLKVKF